MLAFNHKHCWRMWELSVEPPIEIRMFICFNQMKNQIFSKYLFRFLLFIWSLRGSWKNFSVYVIYVFFLLLLYYFCDRIFDFFTLYLFVCSCINFSSKHLLNVIDLLSFFFSMCLFHFLWFFFNRYSFTDWFSFFQLCFSFCLGFFGKYFVFIHTFFWLEFTVLFCFFFFSIRQKFSFGWKSITFPLNRIKTIGKCSLTWKWISKEKKSQTTKRIAWNLYF